MTARTIGVRVAKKWDQIGTKSLIERRFGRGTRPTRCSMSASNSSSFHGFCKKALAPDLKARFLFPGSWRPDTTMTGIVANCGLACNFSKTALFQDLLRVPAIGDVYIDTD